MQANAVPLLDVFEKKLQLEVPLFQRQYVWSRGQQWEPLWEDISHKFGEYLEGRTDAPPHFLGAVVLDQKQTPTTHVERRQIIDGQQRLTTLQVFLAAFRDFSASQGFDELAQECQTLTLNKGMLADPEKDAFKVWPTKLDRAQFADVMSSNSQEELKTRHPLTRRKYARRPDPRPRIVEAYFYFYGELTEFFLGSESEPPLFAEVALTDRLLYCFNALKNALLIVAIDLEGTDDAQVIFETLNARGEPLLPADLLRNYIFLRAARQNEDQESLYEEFWSQFDDSFWRHEVRQGRLRRPRSDLFMQHFLAGQQLRDIPIKHLFVEYKFWVVNEAPFKSVRDELATISRQGKDFRRLLDPSKGDILRPLATFLQRFDVGTAYPFLLCLLDTGLADTDWADVSSHIESYLVRRAVCNLTTKNYNRIFLGLARQVRRNGASPEVILGYLAGQRGESVEWPSDDSFHNSWRSQHAYHALNNARLVHILWRLNESYYDNKVERITTDSQLTIEHILPQKWIENWPLSDGSKGLGFLELFEAGESDDPKLTERAAATEWRNQLLQTIGNLTILTQGLNSAASNSEWMTKRAEIAKSSLLPLNLSLHSQDGWDEDAIEGRSRELFERAVKIWPRPPMVTTGS